MVMTPTSRRTYLFDELQLYTTRGLPPQVRSRLLVLAHYRIFRQKHEKLAICIIPTGELRYSKNNRIIGSAFVVRNTRMNQDEQSELVTCWPASLAELESAATVIYSDAPASREDAYIVKLVHFCRQYERANKLSAQVAAADRTGNPAGRDRRKWLLRDSSNRIYLLQDADNYGLRLKPLEEYQMVNLPSHRSD